MVLFKKRLLVDGLLFFFFPVFWFLYMNCSYTIRPFWCQFQKLVNKVKRKKKVGMSSAQILLDTCLYDVIMANFLSRRHGIEFAHSLPIPTPLSFKISCVGRCLLRRSLSSLIVFPFQPHFLSKFLVLGVAY